MTRGIILAIALAGAACQAVDNPTPAQVGATRQAVDTEKIKARIAILFDTSGSMNFNVCSTDDNNNDTGGDGSLVSEGNAGADVVCCPTPGHNLSQCPDDHHDCTSPTCGNGIADDSRMFKVKQGVSSAVAAFGEIDWALFRFHQQQKSTFVAHTFDNGLSQSGIYQGASSTSNNCGKGGNNDFDRADLVVNFGPENASSILQWMDGQRNGTGSTDIELRGSGYTPIAGSLRTVKTSIDSTIAGDSVGGCRPYRVVLVTDGQENCETLTDATNAAAALRGEGVLTYVIGMSSSSLASQMNQIAQAGSGTNAFLVDSPEEISAALAQIVSQTILVEKCDGADNDCDGVKDNGFNVGDDCDNGQVGACFRSGHFVCDGDGLGTHCDAPDGSSSSKDEICNGIDDNCNGLIDEGLTCNGCGQEVCNGRDDDCNGVADDGPMPGVGDPCGIDIGACKPGHLECQGGKLICIGATDPSPEVCDGADNNCDGVIDQIQQQCYTFATGCTNLAAPSGINWKCTGRCRAGTQTCANGSFGTCNGEVGPQPELCNGQDDDCDGVIDNGFPNLGMPCERGMGLCHTTGHYVCSPDGKSTICDAPVITGVPEVCNGQDDDCDGVIDNLPDPPPPPIGEACGSCGGKYVCQGGLLQCIGGSGSPEVCNGLDDDCNGLVDDGDMPGVGEACVPGAPDHPLFQLIGECRPGVQQCIAGALTCVNYTGPQPEVCDGKDNDCDGLVDNEALCPSPGDVCYNALCVGPCAAGEFPCPFSFFCKTLPEGQFCVPSPCFNKSCNEDEFCDPNTGNCINPCEGLTCPTGTTCKQGRCLDCFALGCPTGQVCQTNASHIGACVVDPCMGITCQPGQSCVNGSCTMAACGGQCSAGQVCENNQCVSSCTVDVCSGVNCGEGQACDPASGNCIADPCLRTNCGTQSCTIACDGTAQCAPHAGVDVLATGGGGLSCQTTGGAGGGWEGLVTLLVVLGGLWVPRRRRC